MSIKDIQGGRVSKLIVNEPPMMLLKNLALEIGFNESLFLQQLFYWEKHATRFQNNRKWVFKTVEQWKAQDFPFWSVGTISNAIKSLKKQKLIIVEQLDKKQYQRKSYYAINYAEVEKIREKIATALKNQEHSIFDESKPQNLDERSNKNCSIETTKIGDSETTKIGDSLKRETKKETTQKEGADDFEKAYQEVKNHLILGGIIPVGERVNDDFLKPEVYKFESWFQEKGLNDSAKARSVMTWFSKFSLDERKQFYSHPNEVKRNYYDPSDYKKVVPVTDEQAAAIRARYSEVFF